jgi:predicted MFS family arabinose efflux permease
VPGRIGQYGWSIVVLKSAGSSCTGWLPVGNGLLGSGLAEVADGLGLGVGSAWGGVALHPVSSKATPVPRAIAVEVVVVMTRRSRTENERPMRT